MKPKWQRARILSAEKNYVRAVGREIWVKIGKPFETNGTDAATQMPCKKTGPGFEVNIDGPGGRLGFIAATRLELLARDENDFADDVPLIPWETFLEECRRSR